MKVLPSCVIKSCENSSGRQNKPNDEITFHRFPTDYQKKALWLKIVRYSRNEPDWVPTVFSVVCSLHFEKSDFKNSGGVHSLYASAVPKKLIMPPKIDCRKIVGVPNAEIAPNLSSYNIWLLTPKTVNSNVGVFTHVDGVENTETPNVNSYHIVKSDHDEDDDCVLRKIDETKEQQTEERSSSVPKEVIVFPPMTTQRNVPNPLLMTQLTNPNPQMIQTNTTSPQMTLQANVSNPQLIAQGNIPNPQMAIQESPPYLEVAHKAMHANIVKTLENKLKQSQLKVKTQRSKINALNLKTKRLENRINSLKSVIEVLTGEPLELPPIK